MIFTRRRFVRRPENTCRRDELLVVDLLPTHEQHEVLGPRFSQSLLHVLGHGQRKIHALNLGPERSPARHHLERRQRIHAFSYLRSQSDRQIAQGKEVTEGNHWFPSVS
jgi:hypothetical protein